MRSATTDEPIDAVVTWVDGDDPKHRQKLDTYLGRRAEKRPKAAAETRYADRGELEYCIASLLRFAPWLRTIFIVTDDQRPGFLDRLTAHDAERVRVVDHTMIFRGLADCLPTFNSLSIETALWRIPGLADKFIYLNDDFFLIKPVTPEAFFRDDKVVLRGVLRPLAKAGPIKRLKRRMGIGRPTLRSLLSEAAERVDGLDYYLDVGHVPHPMRVSTLSAYFSEHPRQLRGNAAYPLRNRRQFWTVGLAYHLEMRHHSAEISADSVSVYLGSRPEMSDLTRLNTVDTRPEYTFLCAQSLDTASEPFMAAWIEWMDRHIGRIRP